MASFCLQFQLLLGGELLAADEKSWSRSAARERQRRVTVLRSDVQQVVETFARQCV